MINIQNEFFVGGKNMNFNLYRFETYGMKNIQELITIDFCPLTVDKKSKKKNSKVKSIYGTNGVGKSAIMNSVYLYKQILLDPLLLKQNSEIIQLNKIINKVKKEFYIGVVFGVKFSAREKETIYKNEIKIKIENNIPYIECEKFYILKDQSINGSYSLQYEVNSGDLLINNKENYAMNDYFKNRTLNILKYSTCTSILREVDVIKEVLKFVDEHKKESSDNLGIIYYLLISKLFADNISIFMDSMDIHKEYDDDFIEELISREFKIQNESFIRNTIGSKRDAILKNQLDSYKTNVERLAEFLKLFKPSLKSIRLDIAEDEHYYYCSKKMVYESYEVDSDYESTGIQKLMSIYNSIDDVVKGKIVFIDELDANINGVYLKVLIEYLNNENKGQLCFTTHNFYPMEYLYTYTNSIDFLGETGKLIPWKKNGHYKPYNQYPEGMIVDSPFNIDPIDYEKVFSFKGDN
jgi:hypothetical protein